jgi:quercetin dioxygenase-like cupin family protein
MSIEGGAPIESTKRRSEVPIIDFDAMPKMAITEKHSDAFGELLTGSTIEIGRLHFKAGQKANPHTHEQEQVVLVIEGRVEVFFDGETREVGPGGGFHAPSWVPHGVTAITDCVMLSCKNVIDGVGHEL